MTHELRKRGTSLTQAANDWPRGRTARPLSMFDVCALLPRSRASAGWHMAPPAR